MTGPITTVQRAGGRKLKPIYQGRTAEGVALLGELIGYSANETVVSSWSPEKRQEFEVYCERVHLKASDNPVRVPPRPAWLPDPWQGPASGDGVWAGHSGTVLAADGGTHSC